MNAPVYCKWSKLTLIQVTLMLNISCCLLLCQSSSLLPVSLQPVEFQSFPVLQFYHQST